jgi:Pathogenicity locus
MSDPQAPRAPRAPQAVRTLQALPNVGPAIARKLVRLGITDPTDLRGQDPDLLFERLCAIDGRRHDPCLLDTFVAVVDHADGAPARPWWHYSRLRKAAVAQP